MGAFADSCVRTQAGNRITGWVFSCKSSPSTVAGRSRTGADGRIETHWVIRETEQVSIGARDVPARRKLQSASMNGDATCRTMAVAVQRSRKRGRRFRTISATPRSPLVLILRLHPVSHDDQPML